MQTSDVHSAKTIKRARSDFEFFCLTYLKINPKNKELVLGAKSENKGPLIPFKWNKAQRRVWAIMVYLISKGLPLKLVVLKSRQVGISTFFCAYLFWHMWRQTHYRAAIVAYSKKTTLKGLNETMATFFEGLPDVLKPALRQNKKNARVTKDDVYFADRRSDCMFVVQKPQAMRGIDRDGVLCTETSFYDNAEEFFGGFLPAMSEGSSSLLVMESSPADGWFKDTYFSAKAGRGDRHAVFIPWWMCDDIYSRALDRRLKANGTGYYLHDKRTGKRVELPIHVRKQQQILSQLAAKEGLPPVSDEQMWWWWHKCQSDHDGDEEWMRQEYPDDDITAFQRASRSAFKTCLDAVRATVDEARLFKTLIAGTLESETYLDPSVSPQMVRLVPEWREDWIDQERRPGLLQFKPPVSGYTYTIGADVADGEGEDDEEGERAFSAATVFCCNTREQVASWRGHIDPTDYGDELVKLGYLYNSALLTVERNNMGRLTEHRVKQLNYPRRFRWPDFNVGMDKLTKQENWETNSVTKRLMIGSFRQWVRDGLFKVRDPMLQDEMTHYRVARGTFEPSGGRFADRIIASSLCVMGVEQTEFKYQNIVMGGAAVEPTNSAHQMAARTIRGNQRATRNMGDLPDEFTKRERMKMKDVFDDTQDIFAELELAI